MHHLLLVERLGAEVLLRDHRSLLFVPALRLRQMHEELAQRDLSRLRGGAFVETGCLHLHHRHLLAHALQRQAARQPHRLAAEKAAHVLTADRRQVLAETLAVQLIQIGPVPALLRRHVVENVRRGRKVFAALVRKRLIDAGVLLLVGDGQREDLARGEFVEVQHGRRGCRAAQSSQPTGATFAHSLQRELCPRRPTPRKRRSSQIPG